MVTGAGAGAGALGARVAERLGLTEIEPGVLEDSAANRRALHRARIRYRRHIRMVSDGSWSGSGGGGGGGPEFETELEIVDEEVEWLEAASRKRVLLEDPRNPNSDYVTGAALLEDLDAVDEAPAWVVRLTRETLDLRAEQLDRAEGVGVVAARGEKVPPALPVRCGYVRTDGRRCLLWSSMKPELEGMCELHARSAGKKLARAGLGPVEIARRIVRQAAPEAAEALEQLATGEGVAEGVRLKAAAEILDRAGVRGGSEVSVTGTVEIVDYAAEVRQRLERLAERLEPVQGVEVEVEIVKEE